jgi:hypothetical protein
LVAVLIVSVIGIGLRVPAVFSARDLEESVRLRNVDGAEEDAVEHAEDDDVCADAEGKREDGGQRKAG